jgi:cytochrome b subunit of formate dehydrogenase
MVLLRILLLTTLVYTMAFAQDNETCEMCHNDDTFETVRYGITHSLHVTTGDLEGTPHEGFDCITCHTTLEGQNEWPHAEFLQLPDCGSCHLEAQTSFVEGFHTPLKEKGYSAIPTCVDCHGAHEVSWRGQPRKVCGVCHQEQLEDFLASDHYGIKGALTCVDCHNPHNKFERTEYSAQDWKLHVTEDCRRCHSKEVTNYDMSGHFKAVLDGNEDAPVCWDCHTRHRILSPRDADSEVSVARLDEVCISCHTDYEESVHLADEDSETPFETCVTCHTGHETDMDNPTSIIIDEHIEVVCLRCHTETLIVGEGDAHGFIHREQLAFANSGKETDCAECHTYHNKVKGREGSGLRKGCGQCHPREEMEYENSTHYISHQKGHPEAPGCIDCHSEHLVQKPDEFFGGQTITDLCSSCHTDDNLALKYDLNPEVLDGYQTSYHGQMYLLGYEGHDYATCVSCHNNHEILPSDDKDASTHPNHLVATCSRCHSGATESFVKYMPHPQPSLKQANPVIYYINFFMIILLAGTLSVFGGHTILWFIRLLIKRIMQGPLKKPAASSKRVHRFTKTERFLHLFMVMSFLILAGTGLPLKYSHTEMANWFVNNIVGFHTAALLHRYAALTMFGVFVVHILMLLNKVFIQRKKGVFWGSDSFVPSWQDARDFVNHILFFLGLRKKEPEFGRWTYWEKFDYFAVFWGMMIIGASGMTLWFPVEFTYLIPGWMINAAHIIHSEEALLATAFIFTVHFFNTHLRPGAFPLDDVIFSGRLTEEKFAEERPLQRQQLSDTEYKKLLRRKGMKWKNVMFYLFGFGFLATGLLLLVLIIIGSFFS